MLPFRMYVIILLGSAVGVGSREKPSGRTSLDIPGGAAPSAGLLDLRLRPCPMRGYKFSTYAIWWVRQAIMRVHRASSSKKVPAGIVLGNAWKKGTAWVVPFKHLAVVMVSCDAVVKPGPHAALLETCGPSRIGKGHFCRASRTALCPHAPRGNPRFTLASDGNPLRRLLVGS